MTSSPNLRQKLDVMNSTLSYRSLTKELIPFSIFSMAKLEGRKQNIKQNDLSPNHLWLQTCFYQRIWRSRIVAARDVLCGYHKSRGMDSWRFRVRINPTFTNMPECIILVMEVDPVVELDLEDISC